MMIRYFQERCTTHRMNCSQLVPPAVWGLFILHELERQAQCTALPLLVTAAILFKIWPMVWCGAVTATHRCFPRVSTHPLLTDMGRGEGRGGESGTSGPRVHLASNMRTNPICHLKCHSLASLTFVSLRNTGPPRLAGQHSHGARGGGTCNTTPPDPNFVIGAYPVFLVLGLEPGPLRQRQRTNDGAGWAWPPNIGRCICAPI